MVTAAEMVTAAKSAIENLEPADFADEIDHGDVLLVDVREPNEIGDGVIRGALLAPRGMLEFHADPATPYHMVDFQKDRRVLLYCSAGSRSALAAQTLQAMGYGDVAHLEGGIKAWKEGGYSTEEPT